MLTIAPSTATLGATVTGVGLNALSDREWRAIEDAFHECLTIGQHLHRTQY